MNQNQVEIANTAIGLSKNPLGILALFIVLVYGLASLVTAFSSSFSESERLLLIYFLILFPVIVLGVFAWLVSMHSGKLYAPSDFKNEDNYLRMQLAAVASLATAAANNSSINSESDLSRIVEVVQEATSTKAFAKQGWRKRILWVDDRPENNVYERKALEAIGLEFSLALSTNDALEIISRQKFIAVISDMGRKEGDTEGYVLLEKIRQSDNKTPLFFYASSNKPEHKQETIKKGGQGCTNNAQELFYMITKAVINTDE